MDKKLITLNQTLLAMLGNPELVDVWWHSPNRQWEYVSPHEIYTTNPQIVINYVLGHYQR